MDIHMDVNGGYGYLCGYLWVSIYSSILSSGWSSIFNHSGQVAKLTGKVWGRVIQASQSSLASIEMVRNDNPATGHQEMVIEWWLNGGKWWFSGGKWGEIVV